jgi:hypothetical protein
MSSEEFSRRFSQIFPQIFADELIIVMTVDILGPAKVLGQ